MRYVSTRGRGPALDFAGVLLAGLAEDGGLYVPENWPRLDPARLIALADRPYAEVAAEVMTPFVGSAIPPADFTRLVVDAYTNFADARVAPLRPIGLDLWLMELFHGPTLAFKDVALQLLGPLFEYVLTRKGLRATIIGATSGDTGSAAIEACRSRAALDIFILHPKGRISEVQRRQMTTVLDANVHNIAIEGTFDDCQALIKALFADAPLRAKLNFAAINSINWARIMAQMVYYVIAAAALGTPKQGVTFSVPTGNFGDVYAGYAAARIGVPIARLIVATNRNDILARFFASGEYRMAEVKPTISPSMDIQIASNFERLLFELYERDGAAVAGLMAELGRAGGFTIGQAELDRARTLFAAERVAKDETLAAIADTYRRTGLLVDPHTAVGLAAASRHEQAPGAPLVCLATAHPAKFPEAVRQATGRFPALPPHLADLMGRQERYTVMPNDLAALSAYIVARAKN